VKYFLLHVRSCKHQCQLHKHLESSICNTTWQH